MSVNKLINAFGKAVEIQLNKFKSILMDEIRTAIRQEVRDILSSSDTQSLQLGSGNPEMPPENKTSSSSGDINIEEMKKKLAEAQNLSQNIDNNPNIFYDDKGNPQDLSNVQGDSVDKVKQNVKRDYSHLIS